MGARLVGLALARWVHVSDPLRARGSDVAAHVAMVKAGFRPPTFTARADVARLLREG